jgi:hypothetical protein
MVDSIKNSQSPLPSTAPKKPGEAIKPGSSEAVARDSFKSLSSGTSVSRVAQESPAVVNIQKRGNSAKAGKLVESLNEAVRFSTEALNVLEGVSRPGANGRVEKKATEENSPEKKVDEQDTEDTSSGLVQAFAEDLAELKSDIVDLLADLRRRAEAADVASENFEASDASVEDVDRAQSKATETSSQIQFNSEEALSAHGELSFERVARLLAE